MKDETRMFPAEASEKLGIAIVTLRKYSDIFEKVVENDNHFTRTKTKGRTYNDTDIEFFKEVIRLKSLSDTPNKPVESIMIDVIEENKAIASNPTYMVKKENLPNDIAIQSIIRSQIEIIEKQNETVKSLLTLISEQNNQINEQKELFYNQNKLLENQNQNINKLLNKLNKITELNEEPKKEEKPNLFSFFKHKK